MEKQNKIYNQHTENTESGLKKLALYKDEIKIMNNRISEIAAKKHFKRSFISC